MIDGIDYIPAALTKIRLQKEIFILDIEQGHEVFIPLELQIDNYPISYRFYDSIINHTQSTASVETKEYFKFKNNFRFNFYKNESFQQKLFEKLGLTDKAFDVDDTSNKLTFKHKIVNEKEHCLVNHHTSQHSKGLQKSKYLVIDENMERI